MHHYFEKHNTSKDQLDRIEKNGYWLVDGHKIFINKSSALIYCTAHNTKDIKYQLSANVFSNINWQLEPTTSLLDLYKQRAQQLRDTYDYVALTYSGGGDSTNMIRSFVDNGIYPDEVISYMLTGDHFKQKGLGVNIEIEKNSEFVKKYITGKGIKFTTLDISTQYNKWFEDPEWVLRVGNRRAYAVAKFTSAYNNEYRTLVDKGKKCCIVHGLEKPNITINNNNNIVCYFLDIQLDQANHHLLYKKDYDGFEHERFYITGDFPELTVKQTHVVANYFQNLWWSKDFLKLGFKFDFRNYKVITNDLLYGHVFDQRAVFSIGKVNTSILGYRDEWLWGLPDSDIRKSKVVQGLKFLESKVDKEWFCDNKFINDFIGCKSENYTLGKIWS
jgi:hypothetical protein